MKNQCPVRQNFLFIGQTFILEFMLNKRLWVIDLDLVKKDIPHLIVCTLIKNLPYRLIAFHASSPHLSWFIILKKYFVQFRQIQYTKHTARCHPFLKRF